MYLETADEVEPNEANRSIYLLAVTDLSNDPKTDNRDQKQLVRKFVRGSPGVLVYSLYFFIEMHHEVPFKYHSTADLQPGAE